MRNHPAEPDPTRARIPFTQWDVPDLLLLDLQMSKPSSLELLRELKRAVFDPRHGHSRGGPPRGGRTRGGGGRSRLRRRSHRSF
jgi:hypothetical protein